MKKIVVISNQAYSLINFRGELLKLLSKKNFKIYCFAPDYDVDLINEISNLGCIPIQYKLNRSSVNPFTEFVNCFSLYFLIKKICPDIVFSYSIKPVIYGSLISYLLKIPKTFSLIEGLGYIFTFNNSNSISNLFKLILKQIVIYMYKISLRFNDKVFFLNRSDISEFQSRKLVSVKQTEFLDGIGLDLDYFSYKMPELNNNKITFLFVGRLLREKGVYEYIEAAKQIKKENKNARFMIVGNTDKNPGSIPLEEIEIWNRQGIIEWVKFARDVRPYLHESSVFVLPSYREGLSRSIQEAMAIGRPIITCDSVGCRETVEVGKNGYLVKVRDSSDLIKKMNIFIKNRDLIKKMGLQSRKMAEQRFDVIAINLKFYNAFISSTISKKLNIFVVSNQSYSLINFRLSLMKLLKNNQYKVYALAPDYDETNFQKLNSNQINFINYNLNRSSINPITNFLNFVSLFFLIKKNKPDIVFSYSIKPVIYGSLISYLLKIPKTFSLIEGLGYIFTFNNSNSISNLFKLILKQIVIYMYKISLRFNDKVFFLNRSDISEFQSRKLVSVKQTEFLDGIGLDLDYFSYKMPELNNNKITFLFVGRLLREKGVYEYIEAAKQIKKENKNARFMIVGNTDKNPGSIPLEEIEIWNRQGIIEWVKFARDVRPYLHESSVFVLPSYREGLSRSIQEAMAIGRPIITCDSVGCRETVEVGKNGYLVKVRDSSDLIKKMNIFIKNRDLIKKMGLQSRKMAEQRFDQNYINNVLLKNIKNIKNE